MPNRPSNFGLVIGTIFLLPFILIGGGLLFAGWFAVAQSKETGTWASVPGKITKSELYTYKTLEEGRSTTYYTPDIEYEYQVAGMVYRGDKIYFVGHPSSTWKSRAEQVLERYTLGQSVSVFYDPNNPGSSVLEAGSWGDSIGLFLTGASSIIFSGLILVLMWTKGRKSTRSSDVVASGIFGDA